MTTRVRVINGRELGAAQRERWDRIQREDDTLASPFLHVEFVSTVATVQDNVFVAIVEDGCGGEGFLSYQVTRSTIGEPTAGKLSDCQAMIAAPTLEWRAEEVILGCGLDAWEFRHLLASQPQFELYHACTFVSPILNLSRGFEHYSDEIQGRGSKIWKHLRAMHRRIERDAGPVRFEAHSASSLMLRQMLSCKSAQYLRSGRVDRFQCRKVMELMERLHATQKPDFSGCLSLLWAGDRLIASHFGLRSRNVWHYWFPCYDRAFARYSPGLMLLWHMARNAFSMGVTAIDLGAGDDLYKRRLANDAIPLALGMVTVYREDEIARALARRGEYSKQ